MGLIGGPLLISSAIGQVIGINEQYSAWSAIAVLPIFLWELLLGLWLVFKGFRTVPVIAPEEPGAVDRAGIRRRLTGRARAILGPSPDSELSRPRCETATAIEKSSPHSSQVVMPISHRH